MVDVQSDSTPRVELTLFSGGQVVDLPQQDYFQSVEIEEVGRGAWTGTLTLFDREGDELERLVIAAGTDRRIRIRISRSDNVEDSATFEGSITEYTPTFEPHGVTWVAALVATPAFEQIDDKRIRNFASDQRISDMVRTIASDRGWDAFIEDTAEVVTEPFMSSGESDLAFIKNELLPQATNARGEHFECYVDRSNAFHFHSLDFLDPSVHQFVYNRAIAGDVVSFSPSDTSLFARVLGGGNTVFTGLSSLGGERSQAEGNAVSGVDGQGVVVQSDGFARPTAREAVHAYVDIGTRDEAELLRRASATYDRLRQSTYSAELVVHGTARVLITDFVQVDYVKTNGQLHYLSGRFRAHKIRHSIGSSGWETTFELLRGGVQNLDGTDVMNAQQTNNPNLADGSQGFDVSGEVI